MRGAERVVGPSAWSAAIAYAASLAIGLAFALWTTRLGPLESGDQVSAVIFGDPSLYVASQHYFLADAWHWPLLRTTLIMPPRGANVAFADAIPIILLPAKLLGVGPGAQLVTFWQAIARTLQAPAAVFALRALGETRVAPNVALAAVAVSVPAWLASSDHVALDSHFLLLIAIGLYVLIARAPTRGRLIAAGAVMLVALLTHVYLLVMAL